MTDGDITGTVPANEDRALDRRAWFAQGRSDSDADGLGYAAALAAKADMLQAGEPDVDPGMAPGGTGSFNWTPLGPSVVGAVNASRDYAYAGRVVAIAPGPGNIRIYAGASNGGVWRSDNGGAAWSPLDQYETTASGSVSSGGNALSIGCLHVTFGASAATDDVWVGTGEGDFGGYIFAGIGIRHSTAGGASGTWVTEATNLAGTRIGAIVVDPDNSANVFACALRGLYRRPTSGSAATWAAITGAGLPAASVNPPTALVVAGTGAAKRYYASFYNDRVYVSPDMSTWAAVAGIAAAPGRIALAVAPSDPNTVYAFRSDGALFRLVSGTFQPVAGVPGSAIFAGGQGFYDIAVAVDPSNPSTVFLGGDRRPLWRGTLTGGPGSWAFPFNPANSGNPNADPTFVGQNVHSDCHFITYGRMASGAPDPNIVWAGTDGGIFLSSAGGAPNSFHSSSVGLAVTQTTYLAHHPATSAVVMAGTQDNGTNRSDGEQTWWSMAFGGDGGGVVIDPNDPRRVMRQYVGCQLERDSTSGGVTGSAWSVVPFPPFGTTENDYQAGKVGFYAPLATTPQGSSTTAVFFGTYRLWASSDWGSTWVTLPTNTAATPDDAQDRIDGNPIVGIAVASENLLFACTRLAVWRYQRSGSTWTRTVLPTTGLPSQYYLTDIEVDDLAAGTLYATQLYLGVPHLYHFDGTSWTAVLPLAAPGIDSPASAVAVDPIDRSMVYVGTDVGVWQLRRTGPSTWTAGIFSAGLPEVPVLDLAVHAPTRLLRAATHGRGVWEVDLNGPAVSAAPELYLRVNDSDDGRLVGGARRASVENAPDPLRPGFNVFHWMSPDIKVRRSSIPTPAALGTPVDHFDFATRIDDYIDSTNVETIDASGPGRLFVEVHNRSYTAVPGASIRVCVLLADASAGLPPLPQDFATHIRNGDTSNWPAVSSDPARAGMFSGWWFADPAQPYRSPATDIVDRNPGVVEYSSIDLSTLSPALPAGHDHVCAAAFVTTPTDQLVSTETSQDQLALHDRHAAHRNLHVVPAGATPQVSGDGSFHQEPQVFVIDFHNATGELQRTDLVFDHRQLPAPLVVALPKTPDVDPKALRKHLFDVVETHELDDLHTRALDHWQGRRDEILKIGVRRDVPHDRARVAKLDRLRDLTLLKAEHDPQAPAVLHDVELRPGQALSALVVARAPETAKPGDRFELSVLQRTGDTIVGGSTYVLVVVEKEGTKA